MECHSADVKTAPLAIALPKTAQCSFYFSTHNVLGFMCKALVYFFYSLDTPLLFISHKAELKAGLEQFSPNFCILATIVLRDLV